MNICLIVNQVIPVKTYGGTERIAWWLAKELNRLGHKLTLIAPSGSSFPFGKYVPYKPGIPLNDQIPDDIDIVHVHYGTKEIIEKKPFIVRIGGNGKVGEPFAPNTIFVSKNHAVRHNADAFVYNGIDAEDYGEPNLYAKKEYVHFLAKAAWRLKNVKGAIKIARGAGIPMEVIGGKRLNIKMGFRFTLDPQMHFHGLLGGTKKLEIMRYSKAMLFPVLWHEPFGIAMIESMYFGCPVFGTPWGSLPEVIANDDVGFISDSYTSHIERLKDVDSFNPVRIHQYVLDKFSSQEMTKGYLKYYEMVLNGQKINKQKPFVNSEEPRDFFAMH